MLGGLFPKLVIGGVVLPVLLCSGCAVPSFRPCDPGAHNPHSCYDYFHKTLIPKVQAGDAVSQYELGRMYAHLSHFPGACYWYTQAANQGYAEAQEEFGSVNCENYMCKWSPPSLDTTTITVLVAISTSTTATTLRKTTKTSTVTTTTTSTAATTSRLTTKTNTVTTTTTATTTTRMATTTTSTVATTTTLPPPSGLSPCSVEGGSYSSPIVGFSMADGAASSRNEAAGVHDACHSQPDNWIRHTTWSKLRVNVTTLRIDANDYTHGTLVAGNEQLPLSSARDCNGLHSTLGKAVIDLHGTPFLIADVPSNGKCECTGDKSNGCNCSQWTTDGWYSAMTLDCTSNRQKCTVRCGGQSGGCTLAAGHLQLEYLPGHGIEDVRAQCGITSTTTSSTMTTNAAATATAPEATTKAIAEATTEVAGVATAGAKSGDGPGTEDTQPTIAATAPAATVPSSDVDNTPSDSSSTAVAIVVPVVLLLLLASAVLIWFCRCRNQSANQADEPAETIEMIENPMPAAAAARAASFGSSPAVYATVVQAGDVIYVSDSGAAGDLAEQQDEGAVMATYSVPHANRDPRYSGYEAPGTNNGGAGAKNNVTYAIPMEDDGGSNSNNITYAAPIEEDDGAGRVPNPMYQSADGNGRDLVRSPNPMYQSADGTDSATNNSSV